MNAIALARSVLRAFMRDPLALWGVFVLTCFAAAAVFAPYIAPHGPTDYLTDPETMLIARLKPPSSSYLFGTSDVGHDLFSQFVYGSRPELIVGLVAAVLVTVVGSTIGLISGYVGGWIDGFIMRVVDVAYSLPFESAALLIIAVVGPGLWTVILAMVLLMWRSPARVARAQTLSLREQTYVVAAQCVGCGKSRIILRYLAPAVLNVNLVYLPIGVGWGVTAEATLSFLGFGDPNQVSWGSMLNEAFASGAMSGAWWWITFPGIGIALVISSAFFVSRPLEQALNPRLRSDRSQNLLAQVS